MCILSSSHKEFLSCLCVCTLSNHAYCLSAHAFLPNMANYIEKMIEIWVLYFAFIITLKKQVAIAFQHNFFSSLFHNMLTFCRKGYFCIAFREAASNLQFYDISIKKYNFSILMLVPLMHTLARLIPSILMPRLVLMSTYVEPSLSIEDGKKIW